MQLPVIQRILLGTVIAGDLAFAAQRQIEVEGQHRSDPVAITRVTVGKQDISCGLVADAQSMQPIVPFESGEDWLQNTSIYLLNRTNKTIVFGQLALWFPETGDGTPAKPQEVYHITLGRLPDAVAVSGSGKPLRQPPNAIPLSLAPGETLTVRLGDHVSQIRGSITSLPFPNITKLIVRRGSFVFTDGMRWAGEYSILDPERPGKWKAMPNGYFLGDPHTNRWPPQ